VAQLACADSVEDMRASLSDGEACPVCGSAEHPYQHQNAQLHALLASLQSELDRCRQQVSDNQAQQATQRALAAATAAQAESLARELTALEESTARLDAEWRAQALAAEAPAPERRTAWFAAETAALKDSAKDLDVREQAARAAAQARDVAQQNCDLAAARNQQLQEAASAARTVLAHAQSAHSALADKKEQAGVTLAALLEDLDDAFEGGWREQWLAGPAAFRLARDGEAQQWSGQSNLLTACASSLGRLEAEHAAAATRIEQARSIESSARAGFEKVDADIAARRRERSALWAGKGVGEIEQALAGAIEQARSALAARQAGSEQAGLAETRAREVLVQIGQRKEAVGSAALAASQALAAWMAGFGARNPSLDIPGDVNELASLLAGVPEANAVERAALTAIDAAAATAATVLAERRARREEHQQSAPSGNLETLGEDLAALLDQRKQAHDDATALRLQLAQDDVRRRNAQALMSGIDRQQVEERRWGRLSELIGSADGKKFRNYAQQFTLDVLLGYANAHLAHLAKRYRLERVTSNGGPSLGLMVRDQDMGGEVRGVNSLSGGESFLVSLALALGLASLSSNRVRVESLFIDEGFGSLDSETLRVAMDALDGLQSMGRKVGVISHVQEMTERIATKIIVQPSGGGSSSVNVQ
jgi:exonuclease SbcC